jgi:hypothetical protein
MLIFLLTSFYFFFKMICKLLNSNVKDPSYGILYHHCFVTADAILTANVIHSNI